MAWTSHALPFGSWAFRRHTALHPKRMHPIVRVLLLYVSAAIGGAAAFLVVAATVSVSVQAWTVLTIVAPAVIWTCGVIALYFRRTRKTNARQLELHLVSPREKKSGP